LAPSGASGIVGIAPPVPPAGSATVQVEPMPRNLEALTPP
jgi:hypothetical protein